MLSAYLAAREKFNEHIEPLTIHKKNQKKSLENASTLYLKQLLLHKQQKSVFQSSSEFYRKSQSKRFKNEQYLYSQQCKPLSIPQLSIIKLSTQPTLNVHILKQCHLIGQFDCKFLICKYIENHKQHLIVFDQHALSERILLENLQEYFSQSNHIQQFTFLNPKFIKYNPKFLFTQDQIQLLKNVGFDLLLTVNGLLVRCVPGWLLTMGQRRRCHHNDKSIDVIIEQCIEDILLETTNNGVMYETLKSLACHNAIKFNDYLSKTECKTLLQELRDCKMPFICAHGRTSGSLLWEYDMRQQDEYKADINELTSLVSVHKWLKITSKKYEKSK
ncbi:unnamed protein product [Didymodactylos carnosus]|uniref:MutL C-terminal dimerisation domain-containing protein n=1 Tax=Didymodactylos carnosus TaxID=1234261 RepID=A0A813TBA9_9BILA|nr:unnamed protein product [Didymodactylos carnosus]CAF0809113.1 unnamed protein product [Didymodactylos carnosus]CAF3536001.1 unnamed protein product [Didymodactylos carnosus]CAF3594669.1 unnamed protein product [Didymodactylos carnosus]